MAGNANPVKVVIIGAGIGGITTAINLKRKLGFTNFTIYERASDVGGTWRDNTYPGCACDVPSHWYSLSSELNPEWTQFYAEQPEILSYWRALTLKHGLYPNIVFNTCVTSQIWDVNVQAWSIEVETDRDGTKKRETITAQLIVSAGGGLVAPNYSNIEGADVFRGPSFHSARWDYGVSLAGKRVGVIGNGCSAAQFIPIITDDPSVHVINFCRTPSWIIPRFQFHYSDFAKWLFRHIPFCARLHRLLIAATSDLWFTIWRKKNIIARGKFEKMALQYMRQSAPEKYHNALTPQYPIGCKRIVVDPGYYACLHRPNVQLEWGGVQRIIEDGLITIDGKKHELDVIIFGTGFFTDSNIGHVVGKGGQTIVAYFDSRGGPEAYLGTTIPGFPNRFQILGPNVASGHASAIFSEEQQIEYAIKLMRPVIEGKAMSFEVREDVSHAYNDDLQRRLGEMTWSACRSYYRAGANNMGKNISMFPGPVLKLWYITRKVRWADYIGVSSERWERARKRKRLMRTIVFPGLFVAVCIGIREQGGFSKVIRNLLSFYAMFAK